MGKLFKWFRCNRGFTLIELLVVVAILGVLAAVAVPNIASFLGWGKNEALASEQASVQTAVDAVIAATGKLPSNGDTIKAPSDDLTISTVDYSVDRFIRGGLEKLLGAYVVDGEGTVTAQ